MSLRDFAKHKPCMVRIPGVCNGNPETTVLAHIRRGNVAGTGQKPPDLCGVWACSSCHDEIDGRTRTFLRRDVDEMLLAAMCRQLAWYDKHEILVAVV